MPESGTEVFFDADDPLDYFKQASMNRDVFELNAEIEETHWWFTARRKIISGIVFELMQPGRDRLVIDVGCGTGANIASLSSHFEVLGVDVTEDAIVLAKKRFPEVRFQCRDAIECVASVNHRHVVILLNDVLEHVERAESFLHEIVEVAPNQSYFVITVPANPALWSLHDVSHGHYRRYTPDTFRSLWTGLPVRELLFSYYNARLYPIVKGLRALGSVLGTTSGAAGTDLSLPAKPINNVLRSIFQGELGRLKKTFTDPRKAYKRGVSLIAILQKE